MSHDEDGTPCWCSGLPSKEGIYWVAYKPGGVVSGCTAMWFTMGKWWTMGHDRFIEPEALADTAWFGPIEPPYMPDWSNLATLHA